VIATLLAGAVALVGGDVYTGDAPVAKNGVVVIGEDGRLVAAGPADAAGALGDAQRVDVAGKWVTPALVEADSRYGLADVDLEPTTTDYRPDPAAAGFVRAAFLVAEAFNPRSYTIPDARREGLGSAAIVPDASSYVEGYGLIAGRSAWVDLDGSLPHRSPLAMHANLGIRAQAAGAGARSLALQRLREVLDDAREYGKRRADFEKRATRDFAASRLDREALLPVLEGKLPLFVYADRHADLRAALKLAKEYGLKLVLEGCAEGWTLAAEIAAAGVGCILDPFLNLPESFDALAARDDNAALLEKAGVRVAISSLGTTGKFGGPIRQRAGNAVRAGLPWNAGLYAVTRAPAELYGMTDYGMLAPGKWASVAVWSGDPLEVTTRLLRLWIRGKEVTLRSRRTELLERYLR
jgi:imidazolonepropionase-like amidohydrolase